MVGEHSAEIGPPLRRLENCAATVDELDAVHDIGRTMAESIVAFFGQPETTECWKDQRAGVAPTADTYAPTSDTFAGKSFVFTGRSKP